MMPGNRGNARKSGGGGVWPAAENKGGPDDLVRVVRVPEAQAARDVESRSMLNGYSAHRCATSTVSFVTMEK